MVKIFKEINMLKNHLASVLKIEGEFIIVLKTTDYSIFGANNSNFSVINKSKLPENVDCLRIPKTHEDEYSLIAVSPDIIGLVVKLNNNNKQVNNIVIDIFKCINDINSNITMDSHTNIQRTGVDLLHGGEKIGAISTPYIDTNYTYCYLFLNTNFTRKTIEIFNSIEYPEFKQHTKRKVGIINISLDQLYESILKNFKYKFLKSSYSSISLDNNTLNRIDSSSEPEYKKYTFFIVDKNNKVTDIIIGEKPNSNNYVYTYDEYQKEMLLENDIYITNIRNGKAIGVNIRRK